MTRMGVSIGPPTLEGALEPRYDKDAQILVAESPVVAEWPFGVDIDGRIVFDLAADRTLMNFDLHIGDSRWVEDGDLAWPATDRRGVLIFDPETVATKSFHLPLEVRANPARELVRIDIGESKGARPMCLADDCVALVKGGTLAGFVLRLA